ncbi:MAG: DUF3552 domain-containing protein [Bdellovibrionaceae bacterium]|nr:DUF3552 domain-containing protein [Bdellovibrionales bacterium]MCB9084106.1 DUF3552 domain-containing protein [Pseudobdellovibrionaceae bacterium]
MMTLPVYIFIGSFLTALPLTWLGLRWVRNYRIREAKTQAKVLVEKAQDGAKEHRADANKRMDEFRHQAERRFEKDTRKINQKINVLDSKLREKEGRLQKKLNQREDIFKRKLSVVDSQDALAQRKQQKLDQLLEEKRKIESEFRHKLSQLSSEDEESIRGKLAENLIQEERRRSSKRAELILEEAHADAEREARYYLSRALNRFARPYCAERGIGIVYFPNAEARKKVVGDDRQNLIAVERICGVDISINEELNSASCLGFDPVRRELARASLEKLIHERVVNEKRIEDIVTKTKKDLFKRIRQDGNKLANELGMKDLHPEIRNMMGALRYRYSFSQNQHYHCAEVGWLCGLLSSELGVEQKKGRRAGLLHDIGKAMDHSMEGGHAVIGADFIQTNGESEEIVHAVRAHHFDEQPNSDLAYLVIAADAMSGARPGARRSTIDSYNQKMADLQNIGNSFEGVVSTYILSAGREVRVVVDSGRVDDVAALDLSRKIAQKIEEECSYPGQIRVTVVRESQAVEYAR